MVGIDFSTIFQNGIGFFCDSFVEFFAVAVVLVDALSFGVRLIEVFGGVTLGYVVGRNYGTGAISACVPVPKGAKWHIYGDCHKAYWSKLKA